MTKKIIEMVREKKEVMMLDPVEAERNAGLAVDAIMGGIKSPEWKTYMLRFVEKDAEGVPLDPRQLKRLLATDDTVGNADRNRNRAYIVSNAPCGAASPGRLDFDFTVESIDQDLNDPCPIVDNPGKVFVSK
jgi:hypothetical protein